MRPDQIRALSTVELQRQLQEAFRELFNLRMRKETRQLANVMEIHKARKNVARIKTILRERELGLR